MPASAGDMRFIAGLGRSCPRPRGTTSGGDRCELRRLNRGPMQILWHIIWHSAKTRTIRNTVSLSGSLGSAQAARPASGDSAALPVRHVCCSKHIGARHVNGARSCVRWRNARQRRARERGRHTTAHRGGRHCGGGGCSSRDAAREPAAAVTTTCRGAAAATGGDGDASVGSHGGVGSLGRATS